MPRVRSGENEAATGSGDELRPVTSLFADVVGSTTLGERLSAAEVRAIIGECVTRLCEAIERFGGFVRSYMGDGVAAFFGIEGTREDDVDRAAHAALTIRSAMATYAREVERAWGLQEFSVRVGIESGRVAIGEVGASDPLKVALGDSVNIAARLQSAARPGSIVVGEGCASSIEGRFKLRSLGNVRIRGRSRGVQAYELESAEATGERLSETGFVGRLTELETIADCVEELRQGRGQVLLIVGDGGVGKSRLAYEARRRVPSDITWLQGRCEPMDQRLPHEPFVQALREWLGVDAGSPEIETRIRLHARGRELMGDAFEDIAPHLCRLLGVQLGTKVDHRLDGLPQDVLTLGLVASYVGWLKALAQKAPLVLLLDNFGAARDGAIELARAVLAALDDFPILVILALRPDVLAPGWSIRNRALAEQAHRSKELRLAPLGARESQMLVEKLDVEGDLDVGMRSLIVERAEGNPLYLEELFAAVSARVSLELPGALEGLLLARIDALPVEARLVLQSAAVLGRRFLRDVLEVMVATDRVDPALATLLRADIIREQGRAPAAFEFRHGLIREAALSTLTPSRYRALNADAARAFLDWSGFEEAQHAELVAGYCLAAGDFGGAVSSLESLSDRLAQVFRWEEACGLLERCLEERRRGDQRELIRVLRKAADMHFVRGNLEIALGMLDEALAAERHSDARLDIRIEKARMLERSGRLLAAEEILEGIAHDLGRRTKVEVNVLLSRAALSRGDVEQAADYLDGIIDLSTESRSVAFDVSSMRAGILANCGEIDAAEGWALKAQALADQLGRVTSQLTARRHVALICLLKGSVEEAFELSKYVYRKYSDLRFKLGQLESGVNLIYIALLLGELEFGSSIGEELMGVDPDPMWGGMVRANLMGVRLEQGCREEAEAFAEQILESPACPTWARISAHHVLAQLGIDRGDPDAAVRALRAIEAADSGHGPAASRVGAIALWVEVDLMNGDLGAARRRMHVLEEALPKADKVSGVQASGDVARSFAMRGLHDETNRLVSVLRDARQIGLQLEEARALVALSVIEHERAAEHRAMAKAIFERCGCERGLAELARIQANGWSYGRLPIGRTG